MACKHRKIESLFVDEGFGALDDEFSTQIKVEKQLIGVSRLTIME